MTAARTPPKKSAATKAKPARKSRTAIPKPGPGDEERTMGLPAEDGKSHARLRSDMVIRGVELNAVTAARFIKPEFGEVGLSDMAASLRASCAAVSDGDLSGPEKLLNAQAIALNVIFGELARRSHANMGEYLDASERYMRLALKAQSQCRATIETLAAIKNPPIVYARQMNVANGPQQVNNSQPAQSAAPDIRTPETQSPPNQLLEDASHGSTQLDNRATTQAGRSDSELAPVGPVNRPQDRRRQG